jgi:hypothetical protein
MISLRSAAFAGAAETAPASSAAAMILDRYLNMTFLLWLLDGFG